MTWVRIDDRFYMHPKFVSASDEAVALWVRAIAYCNAYETDGAIPAAALGMLSRAKKPKQVAAELVSLGLWQEHRAGWTVHDYGTYQPLKAQLEAERRSKRERQQRWRERSSGRFGDGSQDGVETERETPERRGGDGDVDASTRRLETQRETGNKRHRNDRPDPTRPVHGRDLLGTPPPQLPPGRRASALAGAGGGSGSNEASPAEDHPGEHETTLAILAALKRHPALAEAASIRFARYIAERHCSDHPRNMLTEGSSQIHALADVVQCIEEAAEAIELDEAANNQVDLAPQRRISGFVRSGPKRRATARRGQGSAEPETYTPQMAPPDYESFSP